MDLIRTHNKMWERAHVLPDYDWVLRFIAPCAPPSKQQLFSRVRMSIGSHLEIGNKSSDDNDHGPRCRAFCCGAGYFIFQLGMDFWWWRCTITCGSILSVPEFVVQLGCHLSSMANTKLLYAIMFTYWFARFSLSTPFQTKLYLVLLYMVVLKLLVPICL